MIKLLLILLITTTTLSVDLRRPGHSQHFFIENLLKNPGFERGRESWTPSTQSQFLFSGTPGDVASGATAASVNFAAINDNITSELVPILGGLEGKKCLAQMKYNGADDNIDFLVDDGISTIIDSVTLEARTELTLVKLEFFCPTSGNLRIKLNTNKVSDPDTITFDSVYLGLDPDPTINVSQAEIAGSSTFSNAHEWTVAGAPMAAFASNAAGPAPVIENEFVGEWQTTDADLPQQSILNLPRGRYLARYSTTMYVNSGTGDCCITVSDGVTVSADRDCAGVDPANAERHPLAVEGIFDYSETGNRTFRMFGSGGTQCRTSTSGDTNSVRFSLYKFPTASQLVSAVDPIDWFVSVNIGGANPDLGLIAVDPYVGIEDTALSMTINSGSLTAQIPCATTTPSEGVNCNIAAVDESVGVVYTQPQAGPVEACATFTHEVVSDKADVIRTTFQVVQTPNDAQTITLFGNERPQSGNSNGLTGGGAEPIGGIYANKVCGIFNFTTDGQKTLRLMYEQAVTGTPDTSQLVADQLAAQGARDIHWTVKPIGITVAQPFVLNQLSTTLKGGVLDNAARILNSGTPTVDQETGDWIDSLVDNGIGDTIINFVTGVFANPPMCVCTSENDSAPDRDCHHRQTPTTSSIEIQTTSAGTATDLPFQIICEAIK